MGYCDDKNFMKVLYYFFFLFLLNSKLFNNLYSVLNSQYHFELIKYSKVYYMGFILIHLPAIYFLTGTLSYFFYGFILIYCFAVIYKKIGFLTYTFPLMFYLQRLLISLFLNAITEGKDLYSILMNIRVTLVPLVISVIFIVFVYYIEGDILTRTYYKI